MNPLIRHKKERLNTVSEARGGQNASIAIKREIRNLPSGWLPLEVITFHLDVSLHELSEIVIRNSGGRCALQISLYFQVQQ